MRRVTTWNESTANILTTTHPYTEFSTPGGGGGSRDSPQPPSGPRPNPEGGTSSSIVGTHSASGLFTFWFKSPAGQVNFFPFCLSVLHAKLILQLRYQFKRDIFCNNYLNRMVQVPILTFIWTIWKWKKGKKLICHIWDLHPEKKCWKCEQTIKVVFWHSLQTNESIWQRTTFTSTY